MPDFVFIFLPAILTAFAIPCLIEGYRKTFFLLSTVSVAMYIWFLVAALQPWKYTDLGDKTVSVVDGAAIVVADGAPINLNELGFNFSDGEVVRLKKLDNRAFYAGVYFIRDSSEFKIERKTDE